MRLRILLINSSRKWIGEAAHTLMLGKLLHEAGHRVIIGCRRGWELEKAAKAAKIPCLTFHLNSHFKPFNDFADVRRIRRVIRRRRIQIVHCHRGKEHWHGYTALFGMRDKAALVRTRHVVTPLRTHWLNRVLYEEKTDGLICVSRATQASFGTMLENIPPRRMTVIHSAVDSEHFRPENRDEELRREWGITGDRVAIGLVARFQHIKGQREFLRAAAEVARRAPDACFVLFGRKVPENRARLQEWITELGIPQDRIVIETRDVPIERVIASVDIGVSASLGSEGFSRIAVEYMASGLPVVATSVGALPEIVMEGETGYIVPPRDSSAMATRLLPLVGDAELRARLGEAARARAISNYNQARFLGDVVAFYEGLLEDKGLLKR